MSLQDPDCVNEDHQPVLFTYSERDVAEAVNRTTGWTNGYHSKFDELLCCHWDQAVVDSVFRYTLDEVITRRVPGRYGFVIQRNPKRFSHRRKPAEVKSICQPFNPQLFNFNKVKKSEILLEVQREGGAVHWLLVNVSPIDYGHVLLVPRPQDCLPQIMTQESLQLCLDITAMSGHSGFVMVANSLLAYASVNHLHYHFMYIAQPLPAATVTGKLLTKCCFELINHPSAGFGFQLDTTTSICAENVFKVVSILNEANIPHNLVMLRGVPFTQTSSTTSSVVRTLLIPRKPAYGVKSVYDSGCIPPFFAAACELGLGFIPVVDQSKYESLTEDDVLRVLNDSVLPATNFEAVRTKVCTACS